MAELLKARGFSKALTNRINNIWANQRDLRNKINEVTADNPDISVAQLFLALMTRKGAGKSHISAFVGSTELKQSGKKSKRVRRRTFHKKY